MSANGIPELLAEHTRLMEEKERLRKSGQTPSTTVNYELTKLVHQIVDVAKGERSEDVRALLTGEAEAGHLGAETALEWLGEEDAWWSGKDG